MHDLLGGFAVLLGISFFLGYIFYLKQDIRNM
jgi:hypothetical protein